MTVWNRRLIACAALGAVAIFSARPATATDIKTLGRLKIPPDASILPVCTDPVVQGVLNDDLRAHARSGTPVVLTVTVNSRVLAPGVSIQDLSPGDPSVVEMLRGLGAEPPPLADTGDKPLEDPYTVQARRQALMHQDVVTQEFNNYVVQRNEMTHGPSPYDNIPPDQTYQTAIVARASVSDSASELKVVALVDPGGDVRAAKKLVAETIADAILH